MRLSAVSLRPFNARTLLSLAVEEACFVRWIFILFVHNLPFLPDSVWDYFFTIDVFTFYNDALRYRFIFTSCKNTSNFRTNVSALFSSLEKFSAMKSSHFGSHHLMKRPALSCRNSSAPPTPPPWSPTCSVVLLCSQAWGLRCALPRTSDLVLLTCAPLLCPPRVQAGFDRMVLDVYSPSTTLFCVQISLLFILLMMEF